MPSSAPPQASSQAAQRPFLVPKGPLPPRYPLVARWNLFSLDAPSVAATWTFFFAWSAGVRLSPVDPTAMFLTVWILYVVDRLLDAEPVFTAACVPEMADRHRFHHAHRQRFVMALTLAVFPLMSLLHATEARLLHAYVLLGCLLAAWLMLVHLRPGTPGKAHRLPKELAVGLFFPAATCLPAEVQLPGRHALLLLPAMFFGSLCVLNCLFLKAWEDPGGRAESHPSARWGARHLRLLTGTYLLAASLTSVLLILARVQPSALAWVPAHSETWLLACSLSAGLLLLLHLRRQHFRPASLRAAADLALLTPLPVYAGFRAFHG